MSIGDHGRGIEDPDLDLTEPDLVRGSRRYGVGAPLGVGGERRALDRTSDRVDVEPSGQGGRDRYRRGEEALVEGREGRLEAHFERDVSAIVQYRCR